jgi:hypothetical protein
VGIAGKLFMTQTPETTPAVRRGLWRNRWLRRLAILLVMVLVLFLFRHPILRGLANILIVEDEAPDGAVVLVAGGERAPEVAAELYHAGKTRELLVTNWQPNRVERLGIRPTTGAAFRYILIKESVPENAIAELPGQPENAYELGDAIAAWLRQHPDKHLLVCCPRFTSRRMYTILRSVLGEEMQRVHLRAVANPDYDETNWWQSKAGLKEYWQAAARLGFIWTHGRPERSRPDWDPDAYERSLR